MEIADIVSLVEMLTQHDIGEFEATFGTTHLMIRRASSTKMPAATALNADGETPLPEAK